MKYEEIRNDLLNIPNRKTKEVDQYNKQLIKRGEDVSDLKKYVLKDQLLHRTYFQVSMGERKDVHQQFEFIEHNFALLQDWWHVDQLTQFLRKPVEFDYAFKKAGQYIQSDMPFVRRWGYVLFLAGLQKDAAHTEEILSLMKDDEEYYVQMAEAWLICDLAVFNTKAVVQFMENSKMKYSILGKAIQKICDSYRITNEDKEYFKSLRAGLKEN